MILEVDTINVFIKTSHILRDVSIEIAENNIICLIGRNGAGKTTTLRSIMGFLRPKNGSIKFMGQEIIGLSPYKTALMGIGYDPEDSGIFSDLTTLENIEIATWSRTTTKSRAERIERSYSVFPSLERYKTRNATQISGGERKMLSIARALALDPQMLLLDECFEGLSPAIIPQISESIHEIARMGPSILISESNIYHVPDFVDKIYVIERGEIIFSGAPEELIKDQAILKIVSGAV